MGKKEATKTAKTKEAEKPKVEEVASPKASKTTRRWKAKIIIAGVGLAGLALLIAAGVVIKNQKDKIDSIDVGHGNTSGKIAELSDKNADLTSAKSNLTRTIKAYRAALPVSKNAVILPTISKQTGTTSKTPLSMASLTVNSSKVLTLAYLGNTTENAKTTKVRAVYFTMKNLSTMTQFYNSQQFKAITDTGEIVNPPIYAGPGSGNFWYSSSVNAGSSTTQFLPFDTTKNIVLLEWTPPGAQTIDVPIPVDQI